ncbi:MAG: deoxyribonuclease IV [Oligoflexales bacterium]|nr:deoxyribonuclease IV [Oligoflexales bacterium]
MKFVGAHVSIGGGVENAPLNAKEIKAGTFALFTKNQRQWTSSPLTQKSIESFKINCEKHDFRLDRILPHDSYLINLSHPEKEGLEKSRISFLDEMRRCEQLGLSLLNFHPGSSLDKIPEERALDLISESINMAIRETSSVIAVIENTAGQGSSLGWKLEHLSYLVSRISDRERIGICLDTCHSFAAGYDLASVEGCERFFNLFDRTIGFRFLKGMHLNDSKKGLGSRVDRHENLGMGMLGDNIFKFIMKDQRFDNIPLILETPEETKWKDEIEMLYGYVKR